MRSHDAVLRFSALATMARRTSWLLNALTIVRVLVHFFQVKFSEELIIRSAQIFTIKLSTLSCEPKECDIEDMIDLKRNSRKELVPASGKRVLS